MLNKTEDSSKKYLDIIREQEIKIKDYESKIKDDNLKIHRLISRLDYFESIYN